jgi:hypothetical protein
MVVSPRSAAVSPPPAARRSYVPALRRLGSGSREERRDVAPVAFGALDAARARGAQDVDRVVVALRLAEVHGDGHVDRPTHAAPATEVDEHADRRLRKAAGLETLAALLGCLEPVVTSSDDGIHASLRRNVTAEHESGTRSRRIGLARARCRPSPDTAGALESRHGRRSGISRGCAPRGRCRAGAVAARARGGERLDRQEAVAARRFLAATANPHATDAAYAMLARGAARSTPRSPRSSCSADRAPILGARRRAFVLVHSARTHKLHAYDGRETAPAAAKPDRFLDAGGAPRAFPRRRRHRSRRRRAGTLRVLELAHARHGKLPWGDLFAPAIALAEAGFDVSPRLAGAIAADANLARDPRASKYFFGADGKPLVAGSTLRNPAYAATLRTIAREGAGALYRGAIADDIVATVAANATRPGDLTLADLAGYRAIERRAALRHVPPLSRVRFSRRRRPGDDRARDPRPLEPYDIASMGPNSFWSVHFLSEAGRLAYADRARYVGDPAFVDVPAGIVDADTCASVRCRSARRRASGAPPPANRRGASTSARSRPPPRRGGAALDVACVDRRRRRQRGRDDDDDRGRLRRAHADRRRLPAQQRAHRLLVRAGRGWPGRREPRRARQAAALVDVADHRVRRRGTRS